MPLSFYSCSFNHLSIFSIPTMTFACSGSPTHPVSCLGCTLWHPSPCPSLFVYFPHLYRRAPLASLPSIFPTSMVFRREFILLKWPKYCTFLLYIFPHLFSLPASLRLSYTFIFSLQCILLTRSCVSSHTWSTLTDLTMITVYFFLNSANSCVYPPPISPCLLPIYTEF